MKVYLDDERVAPNNWIKVTTAQQTIQLLQSNNVVELSLDHDLGDQNICDCGNGYDVLLWIEEQVFTNNYIPPSMKVHSANTSARIKMEGAIQAIEKFIRSRNER